MPSATVAIVYAVVVAIVVPLGFTLFKTRYSFVDVALAAVAGAALSLIPTIGGIASLVGTLAVFYWRLGKESFLPDVLVSVLVARLAIVPVLLVLAHK